MDNLPLTSERFSATVKQVTELARTVHLQQRQQPLVTALGSRKYNECRDVELTTNQPHDVFVDHFACASTPHLVDLDPLDGTFGALVAKSTLPVHPYDAALVVSDLVDGVAPMEALIFKFALVRKFDLTSAANRLLCVRSLVLRHNLTFEIDDSIRFGLRRGVLHANITTLQGAHAVLSTQPPAKLCGLPEEMKHGTVDDCPCIAVTPRNMDWSAMDVALFKRTWFYFIMLNVSLSFRAQTHGIYLQNSLKDIGLSQMKLEFQRFIGEAIHQCIPVRINAIYIANQPFIFGSILYPIFKTLLGKKLISRTHVIGEDYSKVKERYGDDSTICEMTGNWALHGENAYEDMAECVEQLAAVAVTSPTS